MQRRVVALGACVALCACSGGAAPSSPPAEVRPETPPPSSAVVEAPPSSVVSPSEVAPAPSETPTTLATTTDARHVRGRWVPTLDVEDVSLPTVRTVHVHHPNATVRNRLTTLIDEGSTGFASDVQARAEQGGTEDSDASCRAIAATRALVSILCIGSWYPDYRGATSESLARDLAFEIVGEEVRPTSTQAALVANASYEAQLGAALDRAREGEDDDTYREPGDDWTLDATVLGEEGLHVVWVDTYYGYDLQEDIPYGDIVDQIRSDGPIARMLRLGAFAHGATPPPAPSTPDAPRATGPWRVGPSVPYSEAMLRWAGLPPTLRPAAALVPGDGVFAIGVGESVDLETAQQVAHALGDAHLEPLAEGTALRTPSLRIANGSVNVRVEASGRAAWLGTLPRGAIVVADPDGSAGVGSWTSVVAAPGLEGFSSSRYLDDDVSCVPDATAALAAVPAADREAATRTMLRIRDVAMQRGRYAPAVLFVATTPERSYVSLRALSPSTCRVGDELGRWTLDGVALDALVTRTAQRGGETLVLIALGGAGVRWIALRPGTPAPVWQRSGLEHPDVGNDVVAPALRGPSGRGFWPLAIQARGRPILPFRWDPATSTLVEDAPE